MSHAGSSASPRLCPLERQYTKRRPQTAAKSFDVATLASTAPALSDAGWFVIAALGAKLWTKIFDKLVTNGLLEQASAQEARHPCAMLVSVPARCSSVSSLPVTVWSQKLSRKLVHITTGPIFLLTWPLFR